jgi:hypothetical protein
VATTSEYVERVDAIAEVVRADAAQAEIDRRLGDKTVDALRESGLLRMLLPSRYGGGGLRLVDSFPVVEAMARVNGSTGWNLQIGATTAAIAHDLADDAARDDARVTGQSSRARSTFEHRRGATAARVRRRRHCSKTGARRLARIGGWLHEGDTPPSCRAECHTCGVISIDQVVESAAWRVSGMRDRGSDALDAMFVPDRFICGFLRPRTGDPPGSPLQPLRLDVVGRPRIAGRGAQQNETRGDEGRWRRPAR